MLAPNTATGPIGTSMRRTSGRGIGLASGSARVDDRLDVVAGVDARRRTPRAGRRCARARRAGAPRAGRSRLPATATISSPAARRRAAAPRRKAQRGARGRAARRRRNASCGRGDGGAHVGAAWPRRRRRRPAPVRGSTAVEGAGIGALRYQVRSARTNSLHRSTSVDQTNLGPLRRPRSATSGSPSGSPARCAQGGCAPGERLPSERDLARRLEVGRASVREAIAALQVHGVIETRPGSGSFVAADALERVRLARAGAGRRAHDASPSDAARGARAARARRRRARRPPRPPRRRRRGAARRDGRGRRPTTPTAPRLERGDRLFHRQIAAHDRQPGAASPSPTRSPR